MSTKNSKFFSEYLSAPVGRPQQFATVEPMRCAKAQYIGE
jgi:hypothetical protein